MSAIIEETYSPGAASSRDCSARASTRGTHRVDRAIPFLVAFVGALALHVLGLIAAEHAYSPYSLGAPDGSGDRPTVSRVSSPLTASEKTAIDGAAYMDRRETPSTTAG
jgi:hypothetical protein